MPLEKEYTHIIIVVSIWQNQRVFLFFHFFQTFQDHVSQYFLNLKKKTILKSQSSVNQNWKSGSKTYSHQNFVGSHCFLSSKTPLWAPLVNWWAKDGTKVFLKCCSPRLTSHRVQPTHPASLPITHAQSQPHCCSNSATPV